jgi:hypothetical protein
LFPGPRRPHMDFGQHAINQLVKELAGQNIPEFVLNAVAVGGRFDNLAFVSDQSLVISEGRVRRVLDLGGVGSLPGILKQFGPR